MTATDTNLHMPAVDESGLPTNNIEAHMPPKPPNAPDTVQGYEWNPAENVWVPSNEPVEGGNWLGCAETLVAHGMPTAERAPDEPENVIIGGKRKCFSDEVTEFLLGASPKHGSSMEA